ncbi:MULTISPECIES: hypothetical protein [Rhizobium]|uniref:hypothetical protein n=1 Tax=Rhizobium TaxID=379 RepID=UPI00195DF25A|nr:MULTISPECIES: hypothetical protein [Rhizobium]MBM7049360.1 hypothetical protein [Rhizobium lusitanum]
MAATTEFVLSKQRLHDAISFLYSEGCHVVRTGDEKNANKTVSDIDNALIDLEKGAISFYFKHPSFADDDFIIKEIDNTYMGKIFCVGILDGKGHLRLSANNKNYFARNIFIVSMGYTSFFVEKSGIYIDPPAELKSFYKKFSKFLKAKTQRIEIFSGRGMWFENAVLEDEPSAVQIIQEQWRTKRD